MMKLSNKKNITGSKIKEIRMRKQLSQQDLERIASLKGVDLTRSKLAKIETGMIRVTDEMLKVLSELLETPVEEFFK